ncbi:MAG: membrane protein insertion efficiency factor YidD [Oscillospiraceae bacterium]|nr:membrane protein insertion efficiency factor YidD [Oscillospiraceae bacterium]
MKKILLLLVKLYRKAISPLKPPCCKYYPTCSSYALEAIEKHGAVKGLALAVWRILRCNPWSLGGVDPVPEKFGFYTLEKRYGKGRNTPPSKDIRTDKYTGVSANKFADVQEN